MCVQVFHVRFLWAPHGCCAFSKTFSPNALQACLCPSSQRLSSPSQRALCPLTPNSNHAASTPPKHWPSNPASWFLPAQLHHLRTAVPHRPSGISGPPPAPACTYNVAQIPILLPQRQPRSWNTARACSAYIPSMKASNTIRMRARCMIPQPVSTRRRLMTRGMNRNEASANLFQTWWVEGRHRAGMVRLV